MRTWLHKRCASPTISSSAMQRCIAEEDNSKRGSIDIQFQTRRLEIVKINKIKNGMTEHSITNLK